MTENSNLIDEMSKFNTKTPINPSIKSSLHNKYAIPSIDMNVGQITKVMTINHHSQTLMASDSTGYISAYRLDESKKKSMTNVDTRNDFFHAGKATDLRQLYYQAFKIEFDSLKSVEIEAKINCLCSTNIYSKNSYSFLAANDKSIRLFRAYDRSLIYSKDIYSEKLIRKFDCHQFNINSVSSSSNQLNFISSDDLNINLWDYEKSKIAYGIVDIRPAKMEELVEVISSSKYDPFHTNLFAYSSSRGTIHLCDERLHSNFVTGSLICDKTKSSVEKRILGPFYELFMSISDFDFSPNEYHICSRDYTSIKVWDRRKPDKVLFDKSIINLSKINPILVELYDNDFIFDRFELHWFHGGTKIVTGFYDNSFVILDINSDSLNASPTTKTNDIPTSYPLSNSGLDFYQIKDCDNSIIKKDELNISLGQCLTKKCCFLDIDNQNILHLSTSSNISSINLDRLSKPDPELECNIEKIDCDEINSLASCSHNSSSGYLMNFHCSSEIDDQIYSNLNITKKKASTKESDNLLSEHKTNIPISCNKIDQENSNIQESQQNGENKNLKTNLNNSYNNNNINTNNVVNNEKKQLPFDDSEKKKPLIKDSKDKQEGINKSVSLV